MFDVYTHVLTADVATSGTFTVAYATNRGNGSYANTVKHRFFALGAEYKCPKDFTVSFGTTNATVTYLGTTTLPAGTTLRIEFDMVGPASTDDPLRIVSNGKIRPASAFLVDLGAPIATDTDALIKAATGSELPNNTTTTYTRSTLGTSPLDGVNQTWVLDVPRNIVAVQTKATTVAGTVTITGKDEYNQTLIERLTFAGSVSTSETKNGVKAFKEITSIAIASAADLTGSTVDVGFGDVLGLPCFIGSPAYVLEEFESGVPVARWPEKVILPFEIEATELAAGTAEWVVSPVAGTILRARAVVQTDIVTGGDITFTVGATAVDGLTLTVANSATAGTAYTDTPTAGHASTAVTAGAGISAVPAAAFNGGGAVNGEVEIGVSAAGRMAGTLVTGATAAPSLTSVDVRGTYDPVTALDGEMSVQLLLFAVDPANLGGPQYAG